MRDSWVQQRLLEGWDQLRGRSTWLVEDVRHDPDKWVYRAAGLWTVLGIAAGFRRERSLAPRAFISFEMEDKWARDFLVQHARDERNDVQFVDYSVQNPFDTSWKTQCRERIGRTRGTIVLIGATTHKSDAVLWEIAETARQKHFLFGIQIHKDKTHPIPAGLPKPNVIRWDFDQIARWLATWG